MHILAPFFEHLFVTRELVLFGQQDSATPHTADISVLRTDLEGCDTLLMVEWFLLLQRMKSVHCFKMLGTTHPVAQCHIPGDWNPQLQH
jgi:hypothetical protein